MQAPDLNSGDHTESSPLEKVVQGQGSAPRQDDPNVPSSMHNGIFCTRVDNLREQEGRDQIFRKPKKSTHRRVSEARSSWNVCSRKESRQSYPHSNTLEYLENYEGTDDQTEFTNENTESIPKSNGSHSLKEDIVGKFGFNKFAENGFAEKNQISLGDDESRGEQLESKKGVDFLQISKNRTSSGENSEGSEKIYYFQGAGSGVDDNMSEFRKCMFRGSDCSDKDVIATRNERGGYGKCVYSVWLIWGCGVVFRDIFQEVG